MTEVKPKRDTGVESTGCQEGHMATAEEVALVTLQSCISSIAQCPHLVYSMLMYSL